jgi:hypothetical protein
MVRPAAGVAAQAALLSSQAHAHNDSGQQRQPSSVDRSDEERHHPWALLRGYNFGDDIDESPESSRS